MNSKAGYDEFALFELGKGHNLAHATDDDGLPMEFDMLDLVYARSDKWKKQGAAFYEARRILVYLLNQFGITPEFRPIESEEDYPVVKPYDHTRSAKVFVMGTDLPLGMIGEYKAGVRRALKLPTHSAGFGIGLSQLMQAAQNHDTIPWYMPISKFPRITQDVTLKVPADTAFQPFFFFLKQQCKQLAGEQVETRLHAKDIYQSTDDTEHKQCTFRLVIANYQRTLTDQEVNQLLESVASAAKDKFGAERV
jgi:phenylalanyl-tRNA synthetase beta subunit